MRLYVHVHVVVLFSIFFSDGESDAVKAKVDMIENVLSDFRNASIRLFYNPMFVSNIAEY